MKAPDRHHAAQLSRSFPAREPSPHLHPSTPNHAQQHVTSLTAGHQPTLQLPELPQMLIIALETQRTVLIFQVPWCPHSSSGYLEDGENFGEVPWQLCPHPPFPKQLQLIADREQTQPCTAAAPSQKGCWVWASKREGVWTLVWCPTPAQKDKRTLPVETKDKRRRTQEQRGTDGCAPLLQALSIRQLLQP